MTSLSESRRRWVVFGVIAAAVVIADQLSKVWIRSQLVYGDRPTEIVGSFVRFVFSQNRGGIFGLFGDSAVILAVSSLIVIGLIVVYEWREGSHSWLLTVALGLLLGGAIGNLIDRILYGYVTDFIDVGIGDSRFYTFNVADSAISVALFLLIVVALFRERLVPPAAHEASRS